MNWKKALVVIFLFLSNELYCQSDFDIYLSLPPSATLSSIAETPDGGFIGCGSIINSTDSTMDFYFCRYDGTGSFLWQTQFKDSLFISTPTDNYAKDILIDFNGGFIFSGTVADPDDFYFHTAILGKLDSAGNIISSLYICDEISCNGNELRQFKDSTVIFSFDSYSGAGHNSTQFWRFDQQFDTVWLAGMHGEYGYNSSAINASQYSYVMGISSEYQFNLDYMYQPLVRRRDNTGNFDWEFVFTREAYPRTYPIFQAIAGRADNGMVICGTDSLSNGDKQIFLLDISSIGDSSGLRYYGSGFDENANNISLCRDSGFVIIGDIDNSCLEGSRDIFLFKLDQNEDSVWFKTFPGLNQNSGLKIFPTNEGGYLIYGMSDSYHRIIKTDSLGNVNSNNPYSISANQGCAVFCQGDTAILSVNLPAQTYLWSTTETTSSISVTESGYYSVQVTDSIGQVFNVPIFNVTVIDHPQILFDSDSMKVCNGVNLSPTSPNGLGYAYQWFRNDTLLPSQTNQNILILSTGTYELLVNSQCGGDTASVYVEVNPLPTPPQIYYDSSRYFCPGGGVVFYTDHADSYQWFDYDTRDSIPGANDSTFYSDTTLYLYVTVANSFGCIRQSQPVLSIVYPVPPFELGVDTTLCLNNSITLNPGSGFSSYLWQDSSSFSTYTLSSSIPDTFEVTCLAKTIHNCNVSDTIMVFYEVCSGLSESRSQEIVFAYPNPFDNVITIYSPNGVNGKLRVQDELGKVLFEENFFDAKNFNLSFLPAGIYFFIIESNKEIFQKKFIKLN